MPDTHTDSVNLKEVLQNESDLIIELFDTNQMQDNTDKFQAFCFVWGMR